MPDTRPCDINVPELPALVLQEEIHETARGPFNQLIADMKGQTVCGIEVDDTKLAHDIASSAVRQAVERKDAHPPSSPDFAQTVEMIRERLEIPQGEFVY